MIPLIIQSIVEQPILTLGSCAVMFLVCLGIVGIALAERNPIRMDDEETDMLPQEGDVEAAADKAAHEDHLRRSYVARRVFADQRIASAREFAEAKAANK